MLKKIRAIILAAGEGRRLKPYTSDCPKCLVELGGIPLFEYQLHSLKECGITDITIVTGYCAQKIEALKVKTIHNSNYAKTNMVASLMCARKLLDGQFDILICYGDILYESKIIKELLKCKNPIATAIDQDWLKLWKIRFCNPLAEAETLKWDESLKILEVGKKPKSLKEIQGQYMGLIKVQAKYAPQLIEVYGNLDPEVSFDGKNRDNMFMTSFLQHLIDLGWAVYAVPISGGWLEIDTAKDLECYNEMYKNGILSKYFQAPSILVK